jgi:hypothetical protein
MFMRFPFASLFSFGAFLLLFVVARTQASVAPPAGAIDGDSPCALADDGGALEKTLINFHTLDSCVLRGGEPTDSGIQALAAAKVRTVIDLEGGDLKGPRVLGSVIGAYVSATEPGEKPKAIAQERDWAAAAGMQFISQPLNSMRSVRTQGEAKQIDDILVAMHDPRNQPVYIHCAHGKDRTGMISALYRVRYQGWDPHVAHLEMIDLGHKGFVDHLVTGAMDKTFKKLAPRYAAEFAANHPKP